MGILAIVSCILLIWVMALTYATSRLRAELDKLRSKYDRVHSGAGKGSSPRATTAKRAREEDPAPTTRPGQPGPGLEEEEFEYET